MHAFKDQAGRTWTFSINTTAIKRCRAIAGVDLLGLVDEQFKGLGELLSDTVQLVDVLFVLVKDDADRLGITDEAFGSAMWGDAIEHAADAFMKELTDFFPNPRLRAGLANLFETSKALTSKMIDRMEVQAEALDLEVLAEKLTSSLGNSQESSVSIPAPSVSAN